ncbi:MAG: hypothetical protein NTZ84_01620 [Candidatus Nealsonbacteria bacterium]|nr:hypothetical protein [Candidatus Nealsonbacteria bacterium]
MKRGPKKTKLILFILLLFILSASFAFAAKMETDLPTVVGQKPNASTTFPEAVKYLFNFSMFVGALLVLGVLVWSGFRYVTSGNNPAVTGDVKKRMYGAFLGLLILLSTYLILTTINPGLVILSLQKISPASTSTTPAIAITQASTTFQEIPLGTIIEDLLAGNASTTAHPALRCYKYDTNGDTVDVNGDGQIDGSDTFNYNDFYCVNLINDAFGKKASELIVKINELKALLSGCGCDKCRVMGSCQTVYYPCGNCSPTCSACCDGSNCVSNCSCCGEARGTDSGCPGTDPCPNRGSIDCKRQEIKQLIDGGELVKGVTALCPSSYDPLKDPQKNPKTTFLTMTEAESRTDEFRQAFSDDLSDLKDAELMMKSPYGKRLTLQEFFNLETTGSKEIDKVEFKTYNTSEYCKDFNCVGLDSSGLCNACNVNSKNRMCKIAGGNEFYVTTGDNATFYLGSENYRTENITPGEKCMIDPKEEKGFQVGLIPIGETVDEAENLGERILSLYNFLLDNYQKTMNSALSLLDYPEQCECSRCSNESDCRYDCCKSSHRGVCCLPKFNYCSTCLSCHPNNQDKNLNDATTLRWITKKYPGNNCTNLISVPVWKSQDNVCPLDAIDQEIKKIFNLNADPANYRCCRYSTSTTGATIAKLATTTSWAVTVNTTQTWITTNRGFKIAPYQTSNTITVFPEELGYIQIITMVAQRMGDIFDAVNLEPGELNKCTILDKLTISREKMMKCITGFGVPVKEAAAKERTLSCSVAWDSIRSLDKNLIILPKFPNPAISTYLNCYPYSSADLTAAQKLKCLQNMNSPECASSSYYLLDNYYCCSGGTN